MKSSPQDLLGSPSPNLALPEGMFFKNERKHPIALFPFMKTAPERNPGIATDMAEIQARMFFFFDSMATETS
jgi:hypothetical protein